MNFSFSYTGENDFHNAAYRIGNQDHQEDPRPEEIDGGTDTGQQGNDHNGHIPLDIQRITHMRRSCRTGGRVEENKLNGTLTVDIGDITKPIIKLTESEFEE